MLRGSSLIWVYIVYNIYYTRALADDKWLNNGSFERKVKLCELHNSNLNLCAFCKTNV